MVVMVMTQYRDRRFEAVARKLRARKQQPLTPQEWAAVTDGELSRDAEDVAEDVIELRRTLRKARTFGVISEPTIIRTAVPEPPAWWRLYCYRLGEPYEALREEIQSAVCIEGHASEVGPIEQLGGFLRTNFTRSLLEAEKLPRNQHATLLYNDWSSSVRVHALTVYRLAPPEREAARRHMYEIVRERVEARGASFDAPPPPDSEAVVSPLWRLYEASVLIANETGASRPAAVDFLLSNKVLDIPWLECRTVKRGQGVGFELSIGSSAVGPEVVATAYARAIAASGVPVPEGTEQERMTVELVIAYSDALKRYPAKRGPGNKGVKELRLASLPENVRQYFGDNAEDVDKRYWAKVRALPDHLKPGKRAEQ